MLTKLILKSALVAVVAVGFSGCFGNTMTSGNQMVAHIEKEDLKSKIKKGVTTKEEVIEMFGQPTSSGGYGGEELLTYTYQVMKTDRSFFGNAKTDSNSKSLTFIIVDNVVKDYNLGTQSSTSNISPF